MENIYTGERFLPDNSETEMYIEHFQRYYFARQFVKNKIVLDAACGEGYGSSILADDASSVIGLDIDKEVIENAQKKYRNSNLKYTTGNIGKLPFADNYFDAVVSFETIEHVTEEVQSAFLSEIKRVLRSTGIVILSTPNKAVYTDKVKGENHFHIKEFYAQEFLDFLHGYFKKVDLYCQYPDTGYFIGHENDDIVINKKIETAENSRYIIAVCSENENEQTYFEQLAELIHFDSGMYYFLHKYSHELDRKITDVKKEAEVFEKQQENAIYGQKEYISHLESDLKTLNEIIQHRDRDIEMLNTEIKSKIEEREVLLGEIEHREKDISMLKLDIVRRDETISQLQSSIDSQKEAIEKLDLRLHPWRYLKKNKEE